MFIFMYKNQFIDRSIHQKLSKFVNNEFYRITVDFEIVIKKPVDFSWRYIRILKMKKYLTKRLHTFRGVSTSLVLKCRVIF